MQISPMSLANESSNSRFATVIAEAGVRPPGHHHGIKFGVARGETLSTGHASIRDAARMAHHLRRDYSPIGIVAQDGVFAAISLLAVDVATGRVVGPLPGELDGLRWLRLASNSALVAVESAGDFGGPIDLLPPR